MTTTPPTADPPLTAEEREIIDALERSYGRPLTKEEIHLSLEQARHLGEIADNVVPIKRGWRDQDRHHRRGVRGDSPNAPARQRGGYENKTYEQGAAPDLWTGRLTGCARYAAPPKATQASSDRR